jgi:hypothetical protein
MADIQIGVNQGDTVYYFDQSVGSVVTRNWFFPGGTPTGGTAFGPAIQYNSVNSFGYNASLLVTDAAGITAAASKSNIIVVSPEIANPSITITPSTLYMGPVVTYGATGSTGTGFVSYVWNIPGIGATSGPTLSNVYKQYNDWYALAGTYAGLPGASYVAPVTLLVTTAVGNTFNVSTTATYYKYGPVEEVDYNQATYPYGISGPYYVPTVISANSGGIGLGGSSVVISIDQSMVAGWVNSYFHSTTENCYYWANTDDLDYTNGTVFGPIQFKTIFSGAALTLAGATYLANPTIDLGNYIVPGAIAGILNNIFYITDYPAGGRITDAKTGGRQWSNNAIQSYLSNTYYLSNSSKFIENGGIAAGNSPNYDLATVEEYLASGYYNLNGGYGATAHGPCVPSSDFFRNVYSVNTITVDITIQIEMENNPSAYQYNVTISSPGGTGNSPDTYLVSVQDNVRGLGIASILNNATAAIGSPNRLSNYILFEASPYYSPYESGGWTLGRQYSPSNFNGLRISVTNPEVIGTGTVLDGDYIKSVTITWGPNWGNDVVGGGYFVRDRPLATYPGSLFSTPRWISWLGLKETMEIPTAAPTHNEYFRGWKIGGLI